VRLREYEAKALLAGYGIPVPRGALWPGLPDVPGPWVVKAQIPEGGRGKRGGIQVVRDSEDCRRAAERLLGTRIGAHVVEVLYVEERLDIDREIYLAIVVDREQGTPLLLATHRGGIDVEDAPAEAFVRLAVDPLAGLRPAGARDVVARLGLAAPVADRVSEVIRRLYDACTRADAELVEVNPLAVTRDGRVVAADARVSLDDHAAFRHPEREGRAAEGTRFEQACAALGATGVQMDGTIAVVASGAGLLMATIDLLTASGARICAAVDLGGIVFGGPDGMAKVIRAVLSLRPRAVLVNAYFQLASCETLAQGIAAGLEGMAGSPRAVVRLRGRGLLGARAVLAPIGIAPVADLEAACRMAAVAARQDV
jgi:succinyl-CoA synthetase beta subunit